MPARYTIRLTPAAEVQLDQIDRWWRDHRHAAPEAVMEAMERVSDLLSVFPRSGRRIYRKNKPGVRRLLMRRIRYHLYYHIDEGSRIVEIVAFRHASRGRGPTL